MSKVEIERKFLVNTRLFQETFPGIVGEKIDQGYLGNGVRIRLSTYTSRRFVSKDLGWITIKGKATDAAQTTRVEYEYEIPWQDAREILEMCSEGRVIKTRFKVDHKGHMWDVDSFDGWHVGLWLAEIELSSPDEPFEMPPWVTTEVTADKRFSNANLAKAKGPPTL